MPGVRLYALYVARCYTRRGAHGRTSGRLHRVALRAHGALLRPTLRCTRGRARRRPVCFQVRTPARRASSTPRVRYVLGALSVLAAVFHPPTHLCPAAATPGFLRTSRRDTHAVRTGPRSHTHACTRACDRSHKDAQPHVLTRTPARARARMRALAASATTCSTRALHPWRPIRRCKRSRCSSSPP